MYLLHIIPLTRLNKTYSYTCEQKLQIGQVVKIEVRNKEYLGIVLALEDHIHSQQQSLKKVSEFYPWILHTQFILFATKVSEYTMIELGLVFAMCLPSQFLKKDLTYLPPQHEISFPEKLQLSDDQERALERLKKDALDKKVILLDGVTGSGKTSVYSQFILEILQTGKKALLLIPEISLAEIISQRLKVLLNIEPILWHSNISSAKKRKIWMDLQIPGPQLIIGTRSALFLPMNDLGVIIIDEEHDTSFKQQDQGCYNARDMAILRSHIEKSIPIILSSATPSLETYYHAKTNKYAWVTLDKRYSNAELPDIELVDFQTKPQNIFSKELIERINLTLSQGEQALLFMNKRGFSNSVYCKSCDKVLKCPSCDMPLSYHKHKKLLRCHSCHFEQPLQSCKDCSQNQLSFFGLGVEQVYEEAQICFPDAKICCLSSDLSINQQTEEDQLQLIQDIENKKYDIIVSTQILAKGHNFFNLSTVGILNAEKGLMIQDLRSCEKTFQLLTQMSGRAGRHENTKGYVIIQTDDPSHPLFQSLKNYNRNEFYDLELAQRELFEMPPFLRLASVLISGLSEKVVQQTSRNLLTCMNNNIDGISVHGPTEAGVYRMNSQYRLRFLIQIKKNKNVQKFIHDWLACLKIPSGIKIYIDIDPISF